MSSVLFVSCFAAIGGIMFGLDQGNWSGAIQKDGFIETFCGTNPQCTAEKLPDAYVQFLSLGSSLVQLGAAVGALFVGPQIAAKAGRRETMFGGSVVTIVGVIPMALITLKPIFLLTRFVAGMGIGMVTYALPMFLSEVSPPEMRGMLGASMQLTMVFGMLMASLLNCFDVVTYSISFLLPLVPSTVMVLGIFFFPPSPRFMLVKWQLRGEPQIGVDKARASLQWLRGSEEAAELELASLREAMRGDTDEGPWSKLWKDRSIRRRVIIANMLQLLQQFTGVNAIFSYGPKIFLDAGVPINSLVASLIVNITNLVFTFVMMVVIDQWGRRALLLIGAMGMAVFISGAGVFSLLITVLDVDAGTQAVFGWGVLVCVCFYIAFFAIGWGGVPWVYPSEIFPMDVKEKALSTSTFTQWAANFVIAYIVPQQENILKTYGTFFFYAVCLVFCVLYTSVCVPETKGVNLDDIGKLFGEEVSSQHVQLFNSGMRSAACGLTSKHASSMPNFALMGAHTEMDEPTRRGTAPARAWMGGNVRPTARLSMSRVGSVALI
uniref:Hexose transporter 1 n=1 Tax=Noctiluca scintillans TaxID=2966 RepID=A0A7S1FGY1_NOCSC|mmetsp:Transcript_60643/g.161143  ORF Transcript_60643/g.161143 Transcript_60643/m.161143 type:complete len:549 (+) Transcript_60643:63-1709(+)